MTLRHPAAALLAAAVFMAGSIAVAERPSGSDESVATSFAEKELIWCFQGKGSSLFYDAGVVTSAYRHIAALQANRVVVTGNSSGSIWAAYFACRGFSDESVGRLRTLSETVDLSHIRASEDIGTKITKVVARKPTEMPADVPRGAGPRRRAGTPASRRPSLFLAMTPTAGGHGCLQAMPGRTRSRGHRAGFG